MTGCDITYTIEEYATNNSSYGDNRALLETKAVLGKFTYGKITRQVNHIVYLLDKLTVYERIAKDDTSVNFFLPKFTLPQIMDFIRIANENSAANVLLCFWNIRTLILPSLTRWRSSRWTCCKD